MGQRLAGVARRLTGYLVIASFTAGGTVVKAILTKTHIQLALTEHTILFTLTAFFYLFALAAADLDFCRHGKTLARERVLGNVPLVTENRLYALGSRL